MSRRRARPPLIVSLLAAWLERQDLHACPPLRRAICDAVYDVVLTTASKPRRDVLLLVPNTEEDPQVWTDRVRWCPYCGHRIAVATLKGQPLLTAAPRPVVPDTLPPEVG